MKSTEAGNQHSFTTNDTEAISQQGIFLNGVFRITTGGQYVFSGNHEGQILIEATRNDVVELVLDGVTLHNPNGPAIFAPRSRRVELILTDGTTNTISDGRHPNDETNATIYIQHDLIISGNGTLNVNGNFYHGVRSQDFLTIRSGVINVTSAGDALRGRDGVVIENGTFTLTAGGDGIRSNNDSNPERGFVAINGGSFTIDAKDDGIQAETTITINGGDLRITAVDDGITTKGSVLITGGTIDVISSYEGIEGLNITITGGDITVFARDDGINARDRAERKGGSRRRVGLESNMFVRITGGNVNTYGLRDGIDSNGNIFLEGGRLQVSGPTGRGNMAIDLDGVFTITGGELITAGSSDVPQQATQPVVLTSLGRQFALGSKIEIKNASGNTILDYAGRMAFSATAFSSPQFKIGETYSIYVNGEKVNDVTINSLITNTGGNSGFDGGRGAGGRRPGGGF